MKKKLIVLINIVLFLLACVIMVNCNSNQNNYKAGGYINDIDTIFDSETKKILSIDRKFFRKLPTVHNGLIEIKQPYGESFVIVIVKDAKLDDFALFVIEDFDSFFKQAKFVMDNKEMDVIIDVDDLKSTSMRKSLSFKRGIFISKDVNTSASTLFDLSENDLNDIEEAYHKYLKV